MFFAFPLGFAVIDPLLGRSFISCRTLHRNSAADNLSLSSLPRFDVNCFGTTNADWKLILDPLLLSVALAFGVACQKYHSPYFVNEELSESFQLDTRRKHSACSSKWNRLDDSEISKIRSYYVKLKVLYHNAVF